MDSINTREIKLHNGVVIPTLGYRVDKDFKKDIYNNILTAIRAGYRHFDISYEAETEKIAARAFADSGIPRNELFLTLKLDNENRGYQRALRAAENSLKRMGTEYADLYLVNWPNPAKYRDQYETISVETWRAMETLYKTGKARAIGLANFESRHIEHLLTHAEISPMLNQARLYPGFSFTDNLECANEHLIQTVGFMPPYHEDILNCNELKIFAEKYKTTPRAICIRYLFEKNCIALCQGSDEDELRDNFKALDFRIDPSDILFMDHMKNYGLDNIDPDTCCF